MTSSSRRRDPALARAAKRQKCAADPEGLSPRERLFVEAYVLNGANATRAYQACMHPGVNKHAPIARQMLRKLVEGRIVFTPDREAGRYRFAVRGNLGNFFSGIVQPQAMASPTGVVPEWSRAIPGEIPAVGGAERAASAQTDMISLEVR